MNISVLRAVTTLAFALAISWAAPIQTAQAQQPATPSARPPNILVLWGDDIGTWNISHNNRGMMGYQTPNIDRVAREGVAFTDYYGQQSCTAGRAAFMGGTVPVRTGMTKVGLPGAKEGWQASDPTIAALLKDKGYATAQFGKNHFGDRDEHLPTAHGFDEYFGSLYHLNASEEPENLDYPKDPEFVKKFGPRGVIKSTAGGSDHGHRPADQETYGDDRRRNIGRRARLHRTAGKSKQALLLLVERHAHALPHACESREPGQIRTGRVC